MVNLELFDSSSGETKGGGPTLPRFPSTRYQGSKRKIIDQLAVVFASVRFSKALDLYSGSGTVTLLLRHLGKTVDANDYLLFNQAIAQLLIEATNSKLNAIDAESDLKALLYERDASTPSVVEDRYEGVFFLRQENREIDQFATNVARLDPFRRVLYIYAVGQALMKKRPYNLFHRANLDMRLKDVKRSFGNAATWEGSILEHALKAVRELNGFTFPEAEGKGAAFSLNARDLDKLPKSYDLIYADPPYLNSKGLETNYSNFYGFLNGLCEYSIFAQGNEDYPHKPILSADSGWRNETSALEQLERAARAWPKATIICSYRSDGLPRGDQLREALSVDGRKASLHSFGEFKYALSRTDSNEELYVISEPAESR